MPPLVLTAAFPKTGRAIEVYLVLYYVPVSLSSLSPGVGTVTLPCASLREPKIIRVKTLSKITQLVHDRTSPGTGSS